MAVAFIHCLELFYTVHTLLTHCLEAAPYLGSVPPPPLITNISHCHNVCGQKVIMVRTDFHYTVSVNT
jgi:hypothetical protein